MAKKKIETEKKEVESIKNLEALEKEYRTGKMIAQKSLLLKMRLKELWEVKKISDKEMKFFRHILTREMLKGDIRDDFLQVLNTIEDSECTEKCQARDVPSEAVLKIKAGEVYNYNVMDEDDQDRIAKGIHYRYTVFVRETVPSEFQLSKDIVLKLERGHPVAEEDFPIEKTLIKRVPMNEHWFSRYFDKVEDLLSDQTQEDAYNF